jgi:dTDP-glucose 4,6-dehydratase
MNFDVGIRQTVDWYAGHGDWVARVRDGAYREYYDRHYTRREESLASIQRAGNS